MSSSPVVIIVQTGDVVGRATADHLTQAPAQATAAQSVASKSTSKATEAEWVASKVAPGDPWVETHAAAPAIQRGTTAKGEAQLR